MTDLDLPHLGDQRVQFPQYVLWIETLLLGSETLKL